MNQTTGDRPHDAAHRIPADNGARGIRIAALSIGVVLLLLVLAFVLMVFFVQDETRLNAVGPISPGPGAERGGLVFSGAVNVWQVRGRMTLDADRQVRFEIELVGPGTRRPPATLDVQLALDMPAHAMEALRPQTARAGPGIYVAQAPLPQSGQWRLRIELPEISGAFLFDVHD